MFFAKDKFTVNNFFKWFSKNLWERIAVVFHSWELMFIALTLSIIFPHPVLIGTVAGALLHMILDQLINPKYTPTHKFFYFLIYCFRR